MKKVYYLYVAFAFLLMFSACSNNPKTREQQVEDFRNTLTSEDSTIVLRLCNDAMELLKARQIEKVMDVLCEYDDSLKEVRPLSDSMIKRYSRKFKMFPVIDYELKYFSFMLEGCNDVKYEVTFASAEQAGTDKAATTMFLFNPVKVDGSWKLCVKKSGDEVDSDNL